MKKSIEQIRELTNKAHELKNGSTGLYRSFQEEFRAKRSDISANRDYTASGKVKLIEALQKKQTTKLLQLARSQHSQYRDLLKQAKKDAEDLIHNKAPKVDAEVQERFDKRLREFKTELMLTNPQRGTQLLKDFVRSVEDQALAAQVKDQFAEIIQPILNDSSKPEISKLFEDVKSRAQNPETVEAQNLADFADSMARSKFFDQLVEERAGGDLGDAAKMFLNRSEEYFELYKEEDKPQSDLKTTDEILLEEEAKL
ncbi:hypothetical protein V6B33_11200 [Mangrovibacillus sp. Mu-81]|uniref:hypothetical protein n=1 Tax=Mangrovibacillus sp. Mu-81 TaxID=3121478 RepID=UPI002FE4E5F8